MSSCDFDSKPILNIYGLYQSGKSLLYDAFTSSPSFKTFHREEDFDLLRYPNGLFELYLSILTLDPLIAGHRLSRFSHLVSYNCIAPKNKLDAFLFYRRDFSLFLPGFHHQTSIYLSKLLKHTRTTFHPFSLLTETFPLLPVYRLFNKFFNTSFPKSLLLSISENDFVQYTQNYLDSLFTYMLCCSPPNAHVPYDALILNNVCFPGQEKLLNKLCPKINNILLIRDPIATYIDILDRSSFAWYRNQSNAFFSVNSFRSYLDYFELALGSVISSGNSLILRFEDLVNSPSTQLSLIAEYSGIPINALSQLSIKPLSSPILEDCSHPLYSQYLTYSRSSSYNSISSFYTRYES